ncbi:PIN domain-containing protein [Candidatus Bathyarchaeota archaeon]|nr:PIN domain-containing protein [Candidatus Bathyarchaeota archaeon]
MAYVDTSVLIAAYQPKDQLHQVSKTFLSKRQTKIVSALTFVELSSVLARIKPELELPDPIRKEPLKRRIRAAVEYIIRDASVILASTGSSTMNIGERRVTIPMEYSKAASEAYRLKLRTLDMLHLAYAHLIGRLEFKLDFFVTGDQDILDAKAEIRDSLGLTATHPKEVV